MVFRKKTAKNHQKTIKKHQKTSLRAADRLDLPLGQRVRHRLAPKALQALQDALALPTIEDLRKELLGPRSTHQRAFFEVKEGPLEPKSTRKLTF